MCEYYSTHLTFKCITQVEHINIILVRTIQITKHEHIYVRSCS